MKLLFFLIFSQSLWANSLLETQTAIGIANTLQGTGQENPQQILDQVKENVNQEKQAQEQRMASIQDSLNPPPPPNNNPPQQRSPQSFPESDPHLEQAVLSDQERNQIQKLNKPSSPSMVHNPSPPVDSFNESLNREHDFEGAKDPSEESMKEYFKPERVVELEERPIDYKASTQIFYKNDCLPSQKNCKRDGAVFTNIKSIIFDYAHSRGSFSSETE